MDLRDILIAFPAEEIYLDSIKRDFWITEKNDTLAQFFSYLKSTQEIEISSKLYSLNDPVLISKLEEKFSQFEIHEEKNAELSGRFKDLKKSQSTSHQIDFVEGQDLDSIQVSKFKNGQNPDKLEHFTDWLVDYIEQTNIWQVRYPQRILKISVVDAAFSKGGDNLTGIFSKYATLENLDSFDEKYFIKVDFSYDLDVENNTPNNPEFEFFETRAFFVKGNTCVDPSALDDFDFWYRVIILGEDPYEEDDDDYFEEIDIEL